MKLLRRLFKIVSALVLVVVIAAVALVFVFDPNMFKPRLEAMAREQGVALSIDGNLGWQLWPALGVEVNDIRVAALAKPEAPIAQLEQASLRVAIGPLLRGEVAVHHVLVDGAELDLQVDDQGRGNWEPLAPESEAPADESPTAEPADGEAQGQAMQLAVERISLSDAALRYRNAGSGQDVSLSPLNLDVVGFNLGGDPFELDLGWRARVEDRELLGNEPLTLSSELAAGVTLAEDFSRLVLDGGRMQVEMARAGASDDIRLSLDATVNDLLSAPAYRADLTLEPFNPRALMSVLSLPAPEMADDQALTRFALNATIDGNLEQVVVEPLVLELDDTRIEGRASVTDLERQAIDVALTGDRMDLDRYLPPPSDDEEETEAEAGSGDEELIPLEPLRELDLAFGLDFGALTARKLSVEDLSVRLLAREGIVDLERASLSAYEGRLDADGRLDATGETAVIDLATDLSGLELAPLLGDLELDENLQLSGAMSANLVADTRGVTLNQLLDALTGEASFSGAQVRLAPLNIEQKFCDIVHRVTLGEENDPADWPDYTELTSLSGRALIEDRVFTLENLQAGVARLTLGAEGRLDLKEALYDFTLPLRLGSERTSEQGCRVTSNYWLDRSLSLLRCRGSLDEPNPLRDCRPDSEGLKTLMKDFTAYKLEEEYGEQVEAEKARAQEKVEAEKARAREKLEEEKRDLEDRVRSRLQGDSADDSDAENESDEEPSTEDRLRNLFRR